jgi:ABC-type Zn uptake system ZnuABC Zn-binding protein ZnuA
MHRRLWFLSALIIPGALALAACRGDDSNGASTGETPSVTAGDAGELVIATTVAPITSLVENIVGPHARVIGIVPEGTNSHTFEPAPSVAATLAGADLIFINGLRLEEPTLALAEANKRDDAKICLLGDNTITEDEWKFDFSFPEDKGDPNPHLWPSVRLSMRYAEIVHAEVVAADPQNKEAYDANYAALATRLEALDAAIATAAATVPERNRKLITYHDSWAYWASDYGFSVLGAVQPSDFSEPSPAEIARLIEQVKNADVPAVFGSEVFPSEVLETIAAESGARYIDDLRDDVLPGEPGDERHSYIGLMLANMEIMLPALGGNVDALAGIDPGPVYAGESKAEYPQ